MQLRIRELESQLAGQQGAGAPISTTNSASAVVDASQTLPIPALVHFMQAQQQQINSLLKAFSSVVPPVAMLALVPSRATKDPVVPIATPVLGTVTVGTAVLSLLRYL